jgi:hypothetical protein
MESTPPNQRRERHQLYMMLCAAHNHTTTHHHPPPPTTTTARKWHLWVCGQSRTFAPSWRRSAPEFLRWQTASAPLPAVLGNSANEAQTAGAKDKEQEESRGRTRGKSERCFAKRIELPREGGRGWERGKHGPHACSTDRRVGVDRGGDYWSPRPRPRPSRVLGGCRCPQPRPEPSVTPTQRRFRDGVRRLPNFLECMRRSCGWVGVGARKG